MTQDNTRQERELARLESDLGHISAMFKEIKQDIKDTKNHVIENNTRVSKLEDVTIFLKETIQQQQHEITNQRQEINTLMRWRWILMGGGVMVGIVFSLIQFLYPIYQQETVDREVLEEIIEQKIADAIVY